MTSSGSWERAVAELYDGLASYYAHDNRAEVRHAYLGLLADLSGGRVYEAGCGAGQDTEALARAGFDVVAVDLSPKMVALARQRTIGCSNVQVVLGDSEDVGAACAQFDVVLSSMEIFHHPELDAAIRRYSSFLRPGGRVLLVTNHPVRNMLIRRDHDYFAEELIAEDWGEARLIPKAHWMISSYLRALIRADVLIERVSEIDAPADVRAVQDQAINFTGRYPSFLVIQGRKQHENA